MVKITNPDQMKYLLEAMELHPSLATNFRRGVLQTEDKKNKWELITNALNSLGPPVRTEKEWQKVWFDAKFKVKQKLLYNKKQMEATGGGPFKQKYLNETDKIIADLLQLNNVVDPEGNVFGGCRPNPSLVTMSTPTTIEIPSTSYTSAPFISTEQLINITETDTAAQMEDTTEEQNLNSEEFQGNTTGLNFTQMLEKQTKVQEALYLEVKVALKNIENHLKDSARYERKQFQLKEDKLKLYKLKMKQHEEQKMKENEMRLTEIELKKTKLYLLEKKLKLHEL